MYSKLFYGERKAGMQKRRYTDKLKGDMHKGNLSANTWEKSTQNRVAGERKSKPK